MRLEGWWREGKPDHVVRLTYQEKKLANLQPRSGSAGLVASDGLTGFWGQELVKP